MDDIKEILKKQRGFYASGKTWSVSFRKKQLYRLLNKIKIHETDILNALQKDLNKSEFEGYATEIGMVYEEIRYTLKHLDKWAEPKIVRTPAAQFPALSKIYAEPYGVVLIMAPWNYPFQLSIAPLIGAIAAGNCAIIKPSNYSLNTSDIIAIIVQEAFTPDYISVVRGGRQANSNLLKEKFDYIFFTGSVSVGRAVMQAASRYLTPISLELGGKSPCIVDETADITISAKRIVWGKFLNAGQTCVAPDYLLVHHNVKDKLLKEMERYIMIFFGKDACSNQEFPKIINEKHFQRLLHLMQSGKIVFGGRSDERTGKIEPTILDHIDWDSDVMNEEIFGPILPVMEYHSLKQVIMEINKHPKPLALYYFTSDRKREHYIIRNVSYGGGCINDTIVHLATSYMPFGGVGESGIGGYHGKASFDTFSHKKSVLKKSNCIDIPLRYPPYSGKLSLLKKFMR